MLYSNQECILFSIIFSQIGTELFPKPIVEHDALYSLVNTSIEQNKNIFNISTRELEQIIIDSLEKLKNKNKRLMIDKRLKQLTDLFVEKHELHRLKNKVEEELFLCKKKDIKYITFLSDDYPNNFKFLEYFPFVLFYKGNFPSDTELEKSLAIIGTRNPEKKYGREIARKAGKVLSEIGWWNISGLAIGCDEFSHKGTLEAGGLTGAILGNGLAQSIYPSENIKLAEDIIAKNGFLMSELPPSTGISSFFLIIRDRLQSGLTQGVFVVETSEKSGTLHTVKYALEQKKLVCVWNPSEVEELKNCKEVIGNYILLGKTYNNKEENSLGISIKKDLIKNIISVKTSSELISILNNIPEKFTKKKELLF